MSKAVRIRDHLYEEIERLAKTERRSLISQLEILVEQALQMPENFSKPKIGPAVSEPREAIKVPPDVTEVVLRADPLKRRLHPCKHHLPPSKHCPYGCDG